MSTWLEAVILGLVQGLTEFLPISSSGHLEIAKLLLGDESLGEQSLLMTITLHAATALATLVVYREDIADIASGFFKNKSVDRSYVYKILLSLIPAAVIGILFEHQIEAMFDKNMTLISFMLVVTGLLLLLSEYIGSGKKEVGYKDAIIIGLAQAVAIIPGISRSGATISTALMLGNDKAKSARFSFLMVVPLIFGKMGKEILDGDFAGDSVQLMPLIVGFIAAFFAGWIACKWIIAIVRSAKLRYFSFYCFAVAALIWLI